METSLVLQPRAFISVIFLCCTIALSASQSLSNPPLQSIWNSSRRDHPNKSCLNFCNLIPACNFGTCFMNEMTCSTICVCDEGYTGRWCKDRIPTDDVTEKTQKRDIVDDQSDINVPAKVLNPWETRVIPNLSNPNNISSRNIPHPRLISNTPKSLTPIRNFLPIIPNEKLNLSVVFHLPKSPKDKDAREPKISLNLPKDFHVLNDSMVTSEGEENETSHTIQESASSNTTGSPPNTQNEETPDSKLPSNSTTLLQSCRAHCPTGFCRANEHGTFSCIVAPKPTIPAIKNPETRSKCSGGFECVHGYCDQDERKKGASFRCVCDQGWVGTFCTKPCDLACGPNGECMRLDDPEKNTTGMHCKCKQNYQGTKCDKLLPVPEEEVRDDWKWFTGIAVGMFFLFVGIMATVLYILWRIRVIFVMKIVHYFQHYEEDDGKEFDAFVSYKSTKEDEQFVLRELYPRLESELGFKLCLHFRDFLPGEAIANNIIRAIENSRRTIMVLSPNYINSEWCRMEYQKAQHEMLKMRHKIIPVVLEDISSFKHVDKNISTILKTVTYLEWPGYSETKKIEKFWKQLELSLPKKRFSNSSGSSSSETTYADIPSVTAQVSPSSITNDSLNSIVSLDLPNDLGESSTDPSYPSRDTGSNRLKEFMKDMLKLNIKNSSRRPSLNREVSTDSSLFTPGTTPSPGFMSKDETPLISSKSHPHGKRGNKSPGNKKHATWSHRPQGINPQHQHPNLSQHQSFRDSRIRKTILCDIPQSPVPDVDIEAAGGGEVGGGGGYLNIACDECSSGGANALNTNCDTCLVNVTDSLTANENIGNPSSTAQNNFNQNENYQVKNLDFPSSPHMEMNVLVAPSSVILNSNDWNGHDNPVFDFGNEKNAQDCLTCLQNLNEDNCNINETVVSSIQNNFQTNVCETCVYGGNVENSFHSEVKSPPEQVHVLVKENNVPNVPGAEYACQTMKNNVPNVLGSKYPRQLGENDLNYPTPPVRMKKLQRLNSKENDINC